MKIPKKLKIGGHMFTVEQKPIKDCVGETYFEEARIVIEKRAKQTIKESTLIHEILCHCLNTTAGGNNKHHDLLDSLSEQLYQVLKDNKLLR